MIDNKASTTGADKDKEIMGLFTQLTNAEKESIIALVLSLVEKSNERGE